MDLFSPPLFHACLTLAAPVCIEDPED